MVETRRTLFDIVGIDKAGQIALVLEVKVLDGFDAAQAQAYRRNLLSHISVRSSAYFLVVTKTMGYLW